MESLNAYRKDYESQVELLKDSLKQVEAELRSPAKSGIPKTALIEARVSILSSIKTMQTNYSRFLLDLINKKQLLSALDPPKQEDAGGLVINFTLPDFEKIEVVLTGPGPPAEADDEVNPEEIET